MTSTPESVPEPRCAVVSCGQPMNAQVHWDPVEGAHLFVGRGRPAAGYTRAASSPDEHDERDQTIDLAGKQPFDASERGAGASSPDEGAWVCVAGSPLACNETSQHDAPGHERCGPGPVPGSGTPDPTPNGQKWRCVSHGIDCPGEGCCCAMLHRPVPPAPSSDTPADDDVCPRCNGRGREMNAEVQIGAPSCLACFGTGKKENPMTASNECSEPNPDGGAPCCRPLGHHVLTDHWNGQDEWPAQPVPSSGGRDQHTCEHGSTYADRDEPMHVEPTAPSSDTPGDECDVIPSAVGRCGRGTPSCVADHPAPSTPVPEASGRGEVVQPTMHILRRADGEEMGEFAFWATDGPDGWDMAEDTDHDEDTVYEILACYPVARRKILRSTLCETCDGEGDGCPACAGSGECEPPDAEHMPIIARPAPSSSPVGDRPWMEPSAVVDALEAMSARLTNITGTQAAQLLVAADYVRLHIAAAADREEPTS